MLHCLYVAGYPCRAYFSGYNDRKARSLLDALLDALPFLLSPIPSPFFPPSYHPPPPPPPPLRPILSYINCNHLPNIQNIDLHSAS